MPEPGISIIFRSFDGMEGSPSEAEDAPVPGLMDRSWIPSGGHFTRHRLLLQLFYCWHVYTQGRAQVDLMILFLHDDSAQHFA